MHRGGPVVVTNQPLLMLHVKFADIRIGKMHFIPLYIFFPHLICIDKMRPGVRYVDLSAQMGEQIRWYLSASASSTLPKLV